MNPSNLMMKTILIATALFMVAAAVLTPHSTPKQTLLSYNSATTKHTFLLTTDLKEAISSAQVFTDTSEILTSTEVTYTEISEGQHNITVDLIFDGMVGQAKYKLVVKTNNGGSTKEYQEDMEHDVYGMVFSQNGNIVSGDENSGVSFDQYLKPGDSPLRIQYVRYAPADSSDMSQVQITVRGPLGSVESDFLKKEDVSFGTITSRHLSSAANTGFLQIRPSDYRSSVSASIEIEDSSLTFNGESFETVITVSVPAMPAAPPVTKETKFFGESTSNGKSWVLIDLYNAKDLIDLQMELSGNVFTASLADSRIDEWHQQVLFTGDASAGVYRPSLKGRDKEGVLKDIMVPGGTTVELVLKIDPGELVDGNGVSTVAFVGGIVAAIISLTVIAALFLVVIARRRSADAESSFSSSVTGVGNDSVTIVRDVYGRGSAYLNV